jgi:hypothetical protein
VVLLVCGGFNLLEKGDGKQEGIGLLYKLERNGQQRKNWKKLKTEEG